MNSKEPQGSSCMTCGQLFLLFCDDSGFCHDEAHFCRRIDDKILEAALTLAQPKNHLFPNRDANVFLVFIHQVVLPEITVCVLEKN